MDMLRADKIDERLVPRFADPSYEPCRTRTTVAGVKYALDRQFVHIPEGAEEDAEASVCSTCSTIMLAQGHKAPPYSIFYGFDFSDLAKLGLVAPTLGEQLLLARTHLFASALKFSISGKSQDSLTGHVISFATDAPFHAAKKISDRVQMMQDLVTVHFVGTKQQFNERKSDIQADIRMRLSVRVPVLMRWFTVLKAVHPLYGDLDLNEIDASELEAAVEGAIEQVIEGVTVLESERVIAVNAAACDDAATDTILESPEAHTASTEAHSASAPTSEDGENCEKSPITHAADVCVLTDAQKSNMGLRRMSASLLKSIAGERDGGSDENSEADTAEEGDSGDDAQKPFDIHAFLETNPMNEYEDNHRLLGGAFPWLFVFGVPPSICGPVPRTITRGMQLHYSRRFGRCSTFLFLLFNQLQRSQTARATAARVRAAPRKWEELVATLKESGLVEELGNVVRGDEPSAELRSILKDLFKIIMSAATEVTYSPVQRRLARTHLRALALRFGPAVSFLTVSPNAIDSRLLMRLLDPEDVEDSSPSTGNPFPESRSERSNLASADPSALAIYYEGIQKALAGVALGLPCNSNRRNRHDPVCTRSRGLMGQTLAMYGVTETQARLMLHLHLQSFGGVNRTVFDQYRDNEEIRAEFEKFIGASVWARVDQELHAHAKEFTLPLPLCEACSFENCDDMGDPKTRRLYDIRRYGQQVVCVTGLHCHSFTCRYGNRGCFGCRCAYGRNQSMRYRMSQIFVDFDPESEVEVSLDEFKAHLINKTYLCDHRNEASSDGTLVDDYFCEPYHYPDQYLVTNVEADYEFHELVQNPNHRPVPIAIDLLRPLPEDRRVVPFNPIFSAAVQCNTAWEFTYDDSGCANYMAQADYMSKDENDLTASAALFYHCLLHIEKYPSVASDTGTDTRTAKHFAQRLLNSAHGKIEIGAQMAAHALLGHEGYMSSEKFWYTHIYPAIKFVRDNADRKMCSHASDADRDTLDDETSLNDADGNTGSDTNSDGGASEHDREPRDDKENETGDEDNSGDSCGSASDDGDYPEEHGIVLENSENESCNGDDEDGSVLGEDDHVLENLENGSCDGSDEEGSALGADDNANASVLGEVPTQDSHGVSDEPYDADDDNESTLRKAARHAKDPYARIRDSGLFTDEMDPEEVEQAEMGCATILSVPLKAREGDNTSDIDDENVVGDRRLFQHQQHVAYLYRGDDLKELNLYEYSALIVIQPERRNKAKRPPFVDDNTPRKGRKPSASFPFSSNAPASLRENFVQKLRAMPLTPILAGKAPPSKHFSTAFMEYYLTLLEPWEESMKGPPVPPREPEFRQWLANLVTPETPLDSVQWHRAQIFLRSAAKATPKFIARLKDRHRRRGHTEWNGYPDGIPDRAADGSQDNDSSKRHSTPSSQEVAETARTELQLLRDIAKAEDHPGSSYDESRSALISTMCNTPSPTTANAVLAGLAQTANDADTEGTSSTPESVIVGQARDQALAARSSRTVPELVQDVMHAADVARQRVAEAVQRLTGEISERRHQMIAGYNDVDEKHTTGDGGLPKESALLPHDNPGPQAHKSLQCPVDFDAIWSRTENSTLSPEQKKVLKIVIQYVADKDAYDADPIPAKCPPTPPALLVHGRGGLGKTKIIKTLVHELGPALFKLMTPTGASAKALGGSTLHSALMIRNETGGNINALSGDDIAKLKSNFDGCKVVVIDEVSMVGTRMFHAILSRLKDIGDPNHPFGGFAVVVLGDFFQMNPVKDSSLLEPLINSCLNSSSTNTSTTSRTKSTTTAREQRRAKSASRQNEQVAAALRTLIRIELQPHNNQRSKNDPDMNFLQTALRNTSVAFPVDDNVLNLLRTRSLTISAAQQACDTPGQPSWRDGIMVLRNETRRALNRVLVTAFANENSLPVFQFENKILGDFSSEVARALHRAHPCRLTTRLTIGTPVVITKNQAPADLGVANGTIGKVEGFVYNNPDDQTAFDAAVQRYFRDRSCTDADDADASIISIPFPDRILVHVDSEDLAGLALLATSTEDSEPGDDVIIPIRAHNQKVNLHGVKMTVQEHDLEPAFALTNYKIQSQTRANMALDLVKAPGERSRLCLRALYVGLTRPTSFEGIHILPDNSGAPPNLDHLKNLAHDPYLRVFDQAYDDDGNISNARVQALAATGILQAPKKNKSSPSNRSQTPFQGATTSSFKAAQERAMEKKRRKQGLPEAEHNSVALDKAPIQVASTSMAQRTKGNGHNNDHQTQRPLPHAPPEHLVGAQRWAGAESPGEKVIFSIRGNQYRWHFSCPIDATLFALANAAHRSTAFGALLDIHQPKVAAYVKALWSPFGGAHCVIELRRLRHDAALEMITRQFNADAHIPQSSDEYRVVHISGERPKIISTYGSIVDWIDCALQDRPFTSAKFHEHYTCNSTILDTIRQRANLASTALPHDARRVKKYDRLVAEDGHLQSSNELANSWQNKFRNVRCGQKLEVAANLDEHDTTISITQVVDEMVTSGTHEAVLLGEDRLLTNPAGVVYTEDDIRKILYYTCGATSTCHSKLESFPPLLVLHTQAAQHSPRWIEQPLEVTIDAPMVDDTHESYASYALAAIIQHLPEHWTVCYFDQRDEKWYFHDGLRNNGFPKQCNDHASSIHRDANSFCLVYVKL